MITAGTPIDRGERTTRSPLAAQAAAALGAIATLRWAQWRWTLLVVAATATVELLIRVGDGGSELSLDELARQAAWIGIDFAAAGVIGTMFWAAADRPAGPPAWRARRLFAALLLATTLHLLVVPPLVGALLGPLPPCTGHCGKLDWSHVPSWLQRLDVSGEMMIIGAMLFAWLELSRRNREMQARILAARQARDRLAHAELDARLAAMQAQIDPQFLFETLVDVETAYGDRREAGADLLDRLIVFLRTALPRLRAEGSTVGAEIDLARAWLAVVAARRDGLPQATLEVAPGCEEACCSPMVLLPLVQWLVGDPQRGAVAESVTVRIEVEAVETKSRCLVAYLRGRGGPAAGAPSDPVLRQVRERLAARYGTAATLAHGIDNATPPISLLMLRWPR
jgi:hypothetical protein